MSERVSGIVVVGTSMGGLSALERLLAGLPGGYPLPVAVVQHRSPESGDGLARTLQRHTALTVREPVDKEPLEPGRVYLAPPDYHMLVDDGALALSTDAPVLHARPSVDVLFESAALAMGRRVTAVVMTGASHDGARGAARVKAHGGVVLVQDPEEAESPVMPRAAIQHAAVDRVLLLEEIAPFLLRAAARRE